ncbi:MAG: TonB-dependent receptor [Prevotellaceae bacterium]|nr:TonB-dependent receptor [Prevotellaceae bacterium]
MKKILFLLAFSSGFFLNLTAQEISGKVLDDETSEPLAGVSVLVENTNKIVLTNRDGNYSIEARKGETLIFSYLGLITQRITVNESKLIDIRMISDQRLLDEIVVIGYGTVNKRDLTTAVSAVSTRDFDERPLVSPAAALQGKAAGVQVVQPNGTPGAAFTVRIRGNTSINASNDPLYIVDGTPVSDVNHLATNDIESMQILKDASSAAIYGSRAANGVVLITTKHGRDGQSKIAFNAYTGVSTVAKRMEALDTKQYLTYLQETGISTSVPTTLTHYTNWFDETFRTGTNQNYQLSISNGTAQMKYYLSGSYTRDDGIIPNSSFERYTLRANIDNNIRKWLKVGTNLSYSYGAGRTIPNNIGSNRAGVILAVINTAPYLHIWDPDNPGQYDNNAYGTRIEPPLAFTSRYTNEANSRFLGDVNAEISFTPWLKFKSSVAFDMNTYNSNYFLDPKLTDWGRNQHGEASDNRNISRNLQFENIITFDKQFGHHSINAIAGTTANTAYWTTSNISGQDFIGSHIKTLNAANIISQGSGTANYEWRILSFLARVAYNYDSKYLLSANFRTDGSSKLAPNCRWGYFPSISAAWRISSENFMQNISFVDDLKIRAGWGQTGNQSGIGEYSYLQQYSIGKQTPTAGNNFPGISISKSNIKNKELTWETTTQTNIGIDLSIFSGRISFAADAYYKYTNNLLLLVPLPSSFTISNIMRNEAEMENKGMEFNISSVNCKGEFKWTTDFNISFNRNKLTKLTLSKIYYFGEIETIRDKVIRLEEGKSLGSFYGFKFLNVDPQTGDPVYQDITNDNNVTLDDRQYIGNANPKFIYGMTNSLSYKGLNLDIFIQGSQGNDIFNASRADTEGMYDDKNQSVRVLERWKQPGQIAAIPRATGDQSSLKASSYYIENGSYLRIKNVTLSYNFTNEKLKSWGITKIQPYFTAQNLLTVTKYSGLDPELNYAGNSSVIQGVDWGTYPNVRTFIFGLNVEF